MKFERFIRVSTGRAVLKGLFLVALIFLIESTDFAFAQLGEGEWGEPLNVSRSGATDKPQIVVDSQGVVHLLWQDTIEGYYYSSGDGETWSQPRLVDLPFGISDSNEELSVGGRHLLYEPVIAADNSNRLHAFWRDGNDALFYSSVSANDVAALSEWQQSQQLAESALDVDSDIDGRGRIHIAYVRALDSPGLPSGIYYRRSINRGETWSLPRLLYETPYFRRLNTESANVRIVSTEQDNVVVAWDDRPQERVYVARSVDAGNTWKEPTEIDRRLSSDAINAVGPSRVSVSGHNDQVHLIWMAGHDGQQCSQYTQFSADGGATWQDRQQITGLEGICADESQFIVTGDGRFLLSLETPSGTLISTWTDQGWTQPSIQMTLTSFVNPDTFRPVELACKKFATAGITGDEPHMRLMVVGCDRGVGEDIWYL